MLSPVGDPALDDAADASADVLSTTFLQPAFRGLKVVEAGALGSLVAEALNMPRLNFGFKR